MQLSKTFVAVAALAATTFAAIDWTSPTTIQCSKANWAQIKADADPLLPMASMILSPEQAAKLKELLNGSETFPETPTDEFLHALPEAIPPSLLESTAGKYISPCLETAAPGGEATPTEGGEEAPSVPEGGEEAPSVPEGGEEAPSVPEGGEEAPSVPEGGEEAPSVPEGGEDVSSEPEGGEEYSSAPIKCQPRY
ncbi:hypothetical protein COEREDRAFT_9046 [Coemansia reversa NRRL 1564]|uniref:Uncharacterized protein n=1 Tax=Coemansia reversa (strain ATCC 12441 / NRRL 1564) TaxID=763665 RepID=A0A2G5B9W2_COERN|nr:hypothetical protein COEREDRAFT_9046 [Coemansia reversa NRRL 1564]|eukprot:PIA15809.1 hypothetical protein COEREDRAFT_9046 [Coemansia reversa NRRL 1564]